MEGKEEHNNSSSASGESVSGKATLIADAVADQENLKALPIMEDDGESVGANKNDRSQSGIKGTHEV